MSDGVETLIEIEDDVLSGFCASGFVSLGLTTILVKNLGRLLG